MAQIQRNHRSISLVALVSIFVFAHSSAEERSAVANFRASLLTLSDGEQLSALNRSTFEKEISAYEQELKNLAPNQSISPCVLSPLAWMALHRGNLTIANYEVAVAFWRNFAVDADKNVRTFEQLGSAERLHVAISLDDLLRARYEAAIDTVLADASDSSDTKALENISTAFMCSVDRFNQSTLSAYLTTHGWPAISRAGKELDLAAWTILIHATNVPDMQAQWCARNESLISAGDTNVDRYAQLIDRLRSMKGQPQLFGTQYGCIEGRYQLDQVDDMAAVQRRRKELRLTSPIPPVGERCYW